MKIVNLVYIQKKRQPFETDTSTSRSCLLQMMICISGVAASMLLISIVSEDFKVVLLLNLEMKFTEIPFNSVVLKINFAPLAFG